MTHTASLSHEPGMVSGAPYLLTHPDGAFTFHPSVSDAYAFAQRSGWAIGAPKAEAVRAASSQAYSEPVNRKAGCIQAPLAPELAETTNPPAKRKKTGKASKPVAVQSTVEPEVEHAHVRVIASGRSTDRLRASTVLGHTAKPYATVARGKDKGKGVTVILASDRIIGSRRFGAVQKRFREQAPVAKGASGRKSAKKPSLEAPVNINSADVDALCALPGIGAAKAQAIVDYREANGPFCDVAELTNVRGIAGGILAKIGSWAVIK